MSKLNQVLTALLAVQIAIVGFVYWSQQAASEVMSGPMFENLDPTAVTSLTITDGDGNQLTVAQAGDGWVLPEAGDYPVDGEKVAPLMEKVEKINLNRLVTQTEGSHKQLQVAENDFNRKLAFTLADGSSHALFVGSSAGAGATHVRTNGDDRVFLTGELNPFELNPSASGWVDTLYFTIPQTAPQTITLENGNGTFTLERTTPTTWTLDGLSMDETFKQAGATTLLNQISNIRLNEPLGTEEQAEYGLDDPQATITIETADETYTLELGAFNEDKSLYVLKADNSPYYVHIAQFTGDNLINQTREDFLELPPEEAPLEPVMEQ